MKQLAKLSQIFTGAAAMTTLFAGKVMALSVRDGVNAARTEEMPTNLTGTNGVVTEITHTFLYILGALSVIMLIFGGFKYAVSGGDAKKVTDAKNTILYALIGLVVALLSAAIVDFVMGVIA